MVSKIIKRIIFVIFFYITKFFQLFPINRKRIVFESYYGNYYNDNPKLISDTLKNLGFEITWIVKNPKLFTETNVKFVKLFSLSSFYYLATANVWIDNCRKPYWIPKRDKQLYIQTWHGPVCLKAVEKDAIETLPENYVLHAITDSKKVNYFVSECKWRYRNIRDSFWYDGKIIEGEFRRFDINSKDVITDKVKEYFDVGQTEKILLYVPTFRKDFKLDYYLTDFSSVMEECKKRMGGDQWITIVRLHPSLASKSDLIQYSEKVLNGTKYPSVYELILASDFIISDYSGCIFDGFKMKKPIILYAKDYEDYKKNDRKFYFDPNNLPSPLVNNTNELLDAIKKFDYENYNKKRELFVNSLEYSENDAAILCKDIILKHIND